MKKLFQYAIAISLLLVFALSISAYGTDPFWTGGYYNATIYYQNNLTNYHQEYTNALNSWLSQNYTSPLVGRNFVENNVSSSYIMNCDYTLYDDLEDDDEFGICGLYIPFSQLAYACTCHATTAFAIKMNDHKLSKTDGSYLVSSETIQGYIAHEFGHALGLDDHTNSVTSLMRIGNNASIFYEPQPYDLTNANTSWSVHLP